MDNQVLYKSIANAVQGVVNLIDEDLIPQQELLNVVQRLFGGEIWNSGGNCMILTIEMPHTESKFGLKFYFYMHITEEVVTVYWNNDKKKASYLQDCDGQMVFEQQLNWKD